MITTPKHRCHAQPRKKNLPMNSFWASHIPEPSYIEVCRDVFREIHRKLGPTMDPGNPRSRVKYHINPPQGEHSSNRNTPGQRRCQQILNSSGVEFRYLEGVTPRYVIEDVPLRGGIQIEYIEIRPSENFTNLDDFYSLLLHELVHWTGHPFRLRRYVECIPFPKSPEYWADELVSDLGSACLAEILGLKPGIPVDQLIAQSLNQMDPAPEDIFQQSVFEPVLDAVSYILNLEKPGKGRSGRNRRPSRRIQGVST